MPDQDIKDFDPVTPGNNVTIWGTSSAQNATQVGQVDDLIRQIMSTVARADFGTFPILGDTINESTLDAGVTIDGLLLKDGTIDYGTGGPKADTLSESTTDAGVTADGVLMKDGGVTASAESTFQNNLVVQGQGYSELLTLTSGASIDWNLDQGNVAEVTLSVASATLNNPTNQQAGSCYTLIVGSGVGGGRSLSYGNLWRFPGGIAPTHTQSSNAFDKVTCVSTGSILLCSVEYDFLST